MYHFLWPFLTWSRLYRKKVMGGRRAAGVSDSDFVSALKSALGTVVSWASDASGEAKPLLPLVVSLLPSPEAAPSSSSSSSSAAAVAATPSLNQQDRWTLSEWVEILVFMLEDTQLVTASDEPIPEFSFNSDFVRDRSLGVAVEDEGRTLRNLSVGNGLTPLRCALTDGQHSITFKLLADTINSETTCFGATLSPISSSAGSSYNDSSSVFYRCFNGECYNFGSTLGTNTPVHVNDTITVMFDMDVGTISYAVNGNKQTVAFTGLRGKTLYPAVQFYSNCNQKVEIVRTESSSAHASAGAVTPITLCAVRLLGELARPDARGVISKQQTTDLVQVLCSAGIVGKLLGLFKALDKNDSQGIVAEAVVSSGGPRGDH